MRPTSYVFLAVLAVACSDGAGGSQTRPDVPADLTSDTVPSIDMPTVDEPAPDMSQPPGDGSPSNDKIVVTDGGLVQDDAPDAACAEGERRCGDRCANTANDPQNCGTCGSTCTSDQRCMAGACVCSDGATRCDGTCVNTQTSAAHCGMCARACPMGQICTAGACVCPMGQTRCGDTCVDTSTSNTHCGMCGRACPSGQNCTAGACACSGGLTACGDACVDTSTSNTHCGTCGRACPDGQSCSSGTCVCATGQTRCGDVCVDTRTSNAHCGMCGRACPSGQTCTAGACVCPDMQTRCGDTCVDTRSDRSHCGACGNACATGQLCDTGTCVTACTAPEIACGTGAARTCVDTATDAQHCGGCGMRCAMVANSTGASCRMGACVASCATGFADCDGRYDNGCETNLNTSAACGRCGEVCPASAPSASAVACTAGVCTLSCAPSRGNCDGAIANGCETDTATNVAHCGRCGSACAAGATCVAGRCVERSCAAIRAANTMAPSGVYRIDADGPGGQPDFEVFCDMTTNGGGWTLLATVYNSTPVDTRRWNTNTVFQDDSSFGDLENRATDDFKSPAYARVGGADLLVLTEQYHFGFRALLGGASLASYVRARVTPTCSTTWIRSGVDFASPNLTADHQRVLGFAIRGHDINGGSLVTGCAVEGANENSFLNFLAGPSWWVFGVGNCVRCAPGWTTYDNGMLNLESISTGSCTAGAWPCNGNGLWWQSALYPSNSDTKTRYVQLLVR